MLARVRCASERERNARALGERLDARLDAGAAPDVHPHVRHDETAGAAATGASTATATGTGTATGMGSATGAGSAGRARIKWWPQRQRTVDVNGGRGCVRRE